MNYKNIKVIAFDADDTLWVNEIYFREAEQRFITLLKEYETQNKIQQELFRTSITNLNYYGYGIKSFTLSMIQCALEISNHNISPNIIAEIIAIGKQMINKPIELINDIEEVLNFLKGKYKLIVATKGDLLDQERKLKKSNLLDYFHHIEIMSDKKTSDYTKLIHHLEIKPSELLMVGNSLKSDVLPLIEIGSNAVHIPFHITWEYEAVNEPIHTDKYVTLNSIKELITLL